MAKPGAGQDEIGVVLLLIGGVVLLADMVLLGLVIVGRQSDRPPLARRWSAAHVLIGFQVWLLATLVVVGFAGAIWAGLHPKGAAAAFSDVRWMRPVYVSSLLVQNVAMVAVVWYAVTVLYDQHLVAAGLTMRRCAPKAALGFLSATVVLPINAALEQFSALVVRHWHFAGLLQRQYDSEFAQILGMFRGADGLPWAILLIGVVAPFCEEVFFRGFAYRCFRARWGPAIGTLGSALLFSATHLHPVGLLPIFAVGCALATLYECTGTLVAPFVLHATNNIAAVLLLHFSQGR